MPRASVVAPAGGPRGRRRGLGTPYAILHANPIATARANWHAELRMVSRNCLRGDGRDYPGGRRDARDAVDDERLERVAHGIDHAGSILGVLTEEPAERPDLERELERGHAIV